jgi:hypothetical protein
MQDAKQYERPARAATRAVVVALMAVAWLAPATPARAALPISTATRPAGVAPIVQQPSSSADRTVTASRRGRQLVNDRKSIRAEVGKGRTPVKRR